MPYEIIPLKYKVMCNYKNIESVGIVTEPINGVQKFVGAKAQAAMKQEYDILDLTEQAVNEIVKATMPTLS